MLCAMGDVEMRVLRRDLDHLRIQILRSRWTKIHQKLSGTNNATHLPFRSWCGSCVAGKMPEVPHTRRSSHHDVPETKMDHFFMNR